MPGKAMLLSTGLGGYDRARVRHGRQGDRRQRGLWVPIDLRSGRERRRRHRRLDESYGRRAERTALGIDEWA